MKQEGNSFRAEISKAAQKEEEQVGLPKEKNEIGTSPEEVGFLILDKGEEDWRRQQKERDLCLEDRRLDNQRKSDENHLRIIAATFIFSYLLMYSGGLFLIILLQGCHGLPIGVINFRSFHISDTSFSILVGSTTITVLGLIAIILKSLFSEQKTG